MSARQETPGSQKQAKSDPAMAGFFSRMGKPISFTSRQLGYEHCKAMGLDTEMAMRAVNAMADSLERDDPYTAQCHGMKFLDVTGMYRLMAALLTPIADAPTVKGKKK